MERKAADVPRNDQWNEKPQMFPEMINGTKSRRVFDQRIVNWVIDERELS